MPDITPQKLSRAGGVGFSKMDHFRKSRMKMLKEYAGRFYNARTREDGKASPVNMMHQAATTMVPNLVYNDPKARITTNYLMYRDYASILELAVNHLTTEIGLRKTMRMVITDAIFLCGWIKTGLTVSGVTLDIDGYEHDLGQPYADRVDPDDMTIDANARTLEEAYFIGNRYRVAKQLLIEQEILPAREVERLNSRFDYPASESEASMLSQSTESYNYVSGGEQGPVEYVDLVDYWVPHYNIIATLPYDPSGTSVGGDFLQVVHHDGPESGPYHQLGFAWVPDNIMPVAPAMVWYDLHMMGNRIARKIARQAERLKRVLAYESSAWEDAADIVDADDGESVRVDNVDAVKEVEYGGTTEDAYQYMDWAKNNFAEMAMNIDLLSGAGTNENTATQAEIIQSNTSVRLADMQNIVYHFTSDVMRDLMFFLHTDPLIRLPLVKREQGQEVQVEYSPEMREGDWTDYFLKVQPYSMARQDPNVKVRRLMEFAGNVIPAFAQAFMMLGPAFNIENAINLVGREMGIEELDEIINSPQLHQRLQMIQQMIESGHPVDQKVIQTMMNPLGVSGGAAAGTAGGEEQRGPGGGRPDQPNPLGNIGAGINPSTERNQRRQQTAGEGQRTYGDQSDRAQSGRMALR